MDIFSILSIVFIAASFLAVYVRPQVVLGVQLLATPIFGHGLSSLGLGIGAVNLILAMVLFSLLVFALRNKGFRFLPSTFIEIMVLCLVAWVAITLIYTPSPNYGKSKLLFLLVISFPCLYIARLYFSNFTNARITAVSIGWYAIAVVFFFAAYVAVNSTGQIRISSTFFGALTLGYVTVATIPFLYAVFSTSGTLGRLLSGASFIFAAYILAATGSRGPMLALVVATLLSLLRIRKFFRISLALTIAASLSYLIASQYASSGLERIIGSTEGGANSVDSRISLLQAATEQFWLHPLFGQGSGSFSYFFHSQDVRYYPHNSFFEIAGELGLLGLVLFITILYYCTKRIIKLRTNRLLNQPNYYWVIVCVQALFYIGLINAFLSNDFPSQRILFASLGLMAATSRWA